MKKNKVGLILAGVLAVALVAGMVYILLRPDNNTRAQTLNNAGTGYRGSQTEAGQLTENDTGTGYQGGRNQETDDTELTENSEDVTPLNGRGNAQAGTQSATDGTGGGYRGGQGTSSGQGASGTGQGYNPTSPAIAADDWETVTGSVLVVDSELTLETEEGTLVVGLGQADYRDTAQFTIQVGDQVKVQGYDEDGEFKAGTVENLTTGQTLTLRDTTGRPMWAGQGRRAQSQ